MVSSRPCRWPAQPWTSPTANTVWPSSANGAGVQGEISTATGIALRLALVGRARLLALWGTALELFLDRTVEVEVDLRSLVAHHPDADDQHVVALVHGIDADLRHARDA